MKSIISIFLLSFSASAQIVRQNSNSTIDSTKLPLTGGSVTGQVNVSSAGVSLPSANVSGLIVGSPVISSVGAAAVYSGVMSNVKVNDTADHSADASHVIAALGVTTTTENSNIATFGVEGRVNAIDVSPTPSKTVFHTGALGYVNGYDATSRPDNNYLVGVEGRAYKTTASDGGGTPISTGIVAGMGIFNVTGGAANYGMLATAGTLNHFAGKMGIGSGNTVPTTALSVYGVSATSGPVISTITCNAGSAVLSATQNSNQAGDFVVGDGSIFCTITFSVAYSKKPLCFCNNQDTTMAMRAYSNTTTLLCVGASTFTTGDHVNYWCAATP